MLHRDRLDLYKELEQNSDPTKIYKFNDLIDKDSWQMFATDVKGGSVKVYWRRKPKTPRIEDGVKSCPITKQYLL